MKNFRTQINDVYNDNFALITICINWKLIVDVDFGAKHFCRPSDTKSKGAKTPQIHGCQIGNCGSTKMLCTKIHIYNQFPVDTNGN